MYPWEKNVHKSFYFTELPRSHKTRKGYVWEKPWHLEYTKTARAVYMKEFQAKDSYFRFQIQFLGFVKMTKSRSKTDEVL